jgi:molybdopterin-containing oxidoreductase family membrane subunit
MWSGLTTIQPAAKEKSSEEKSQEISPEDLTKISGIGPGIQMRLNQAGIYTYAQLARTTHEQLRKALGKFAQLVDTYDWIGDARNLS